MSIFVRVDPERAGPGALGILIPPGRQTLVVLRPKALAWDLLPARWEGDARRPPVFCQFSREEAPGVARGLVQTLEEAAARRVNPLETFGNPQSPQIWLRTPEHVWIVCARASGEGYRPVVFPCLEEAHRAGEELAGYFWPRESQEVYFNTQKFQ